MKRQAFTLVELMASLVVFAILAGMVMLALSGAQADARVKRARSQVQNLAGMIQQEIGEFYVRRYRLDTQMLGSSIPVDLRLSPDEASRARLMLTRDQMRMELPDRITDLAVPPLVPVPGRDAPGLYVHGRHPFDGSDRWGYLEREVLPAGQGLPRRSVAQDRYQRQVVRLMKSAQKIPQNAGWNEAVTEWAKDEDSRRYESAECLYLILSNVTVDGLAVIDMLNRSEIGDTNDNGIPEILDVWGNPVMWIRWPIGYWLTYAIRDQVPVGNNSLNSQAVYEHMLRQRQRLGSDAADVLLSDWRFFDPDDRMTTLDDAQENRDDIDPFNCPPLIVSAGPDGEFDILHAPEIDNAGFPTYADGRSFLAYGLMQWPGRWMFDSDGNPVPPPNGVPYYYPDPYLTNYLPQGVRSMPGAFIGDLRDDRSADNIFSGGAE